MKVDVSSQSGGAASNPSTVQSGTAPATPNYGTVTEFVGTTSGNYQNLSGPDATGPNVTVASSVLPSGAATSANQSTEITALQAIQSQTNGVATAANQTSEITQLTGINGKLTTTANGLKTDGSGVTQPVSGTVAVSSLPSIPAGSNAIGSVSVSNFPATQPVSGSVSVSNFPSTQSVTQGTSPWVENLSQVGGTNITLGQKAMAASLPVTLASDQPALSVQNSSVALTTGSAAALNADVLASVNVANYSAVVVQINGTFSGTLSFQGSGDAVTWYSVQATNTATANATPVLSTTTLGTWLIPVQTTYLRIRMTAYTSGSATGTAQALTNPPQDLGARNVAVTSGTITTVSTVSTVTSATVTPTKGTITDGSGTTSATASTATTALATNATRKYLFIQNVSSSATIWFNFTTTAVASQPSIPLPPLAAYVQEAGFISTEAISVISTTASVPYVIKQA